MVKQFRIGLWFLFATALSCASLRAPAGDAPAEETKPSAGDGPIHVSVVEGRPNGLVLSVDGDARAGGATTLELYRQRDDDDPKLIHDVAVRDIADRLPFDIVDGEVRPGARYRYHAVLADDEGVISVGRSDRVDWREPPSVVDRVTATALFGDVIEVSWDAPVDAGAVIFRRDVLAEGSAFERVAELEPGYGGRWFDRHVRPAGVWSYRVALSHGEGFVQYGPPSEEVYASTPEESP